MPAPTESPAAVASPPVPAPRGAPGAPAWWPWAAGLLLGLVVMGPGLGAGSLLSLDLLVTPHIPIPNGMFGLGPALSQRVPLFALIGAVAAVVGGPVAVKLLLVGSTAAAFAGAARLARLLAPPDLPVGLLGQAAAGVLWAAGPYALTRIGVGHVNLVWAVGVLPWALPRLCRPIDHLPSTFLASLALAVGGPGGGTLGLAVGAIALVVRVPPRRWPRPAAVIAAPHVIWIAPTAVLLWAGAGVTGSGSFATVAHRWWGWPAIAGGGGFWRADQQVAARGALGAAAALVVLALAVVGGRRVVEAGGWRSWSGAATVVAIAGLALSAATAVPGLRAGYGWLSDLPIGAPLRESQRFSALWLVWAAPVAAIGAEALARRRPGVARRPDARVAAAVRALPLAAALVLSVPGWWGIGGRLDPVSFPVGWQLARREIRQHPGTAIALPWSEYPSLSFAGGRQVFNPLPDYLGGDVISSYDPLFDPAVPSQEQVDRRAVVVDRLARAARRGQPIGTDLAQLGVRWVVVAHEDAWASYTGIVDDPALRRAIARDDLDLYEVVAWPGPVVTPRGGTAAVSRPVAPLLRTSAPAGSVVSMAGAPGWMRGGSPAEVTADGRLQLPAGGSRIWFWPAPVLVSIDAVVLVAALACLRSRRRRLGRILATREARG